jgi:flagellar basal body-associated protein FliL
VRRGTLITIIVLFVLLAAAAVWQFVLFLRTEPTGPPGPVPTASP